MTGRIQSPLTLWGLLGLMGAAACANDATTTSPSTIAVTSTTYVTIPARTTTVPPAAVSGIGDAGQTVADEPDDPAVERIHLVESGDYLLAIARDYDVPIEYIPAYNGWTDGTAHALVPGQEVRIPPSDWTPPVEGADDSAGSSAEAPAPEGTCGTYEIRSGDTPARVAAAHDVTVAELAAANQATPNYGAFVVGIEIVIPC